MVLDEAARNKLTELVANQGARAVARDFGVSRGALERAARGGPISDHTVKALSRIAPRVRRAAEFAGAPAFRPLAPKDGPFCWDLETIRKARDDQMRGVFELPVRMAEQMRTDDALFNARRNRISPQFALSAPLIAAPGARGEGVLRKAQASVSTPRSVLAGIHGTLVDHGLAIGFIERDTAADGGIVNFRLSEWPLEYVRARRKSGRIDLITSTLEGETIDIRHGNGLFIVFRKFDVKPWAQEACLIPGGFVWAAHAGGIKDWASGSRAHGLAQVLGELPPGIALLDESGALSKEAEAFLKVLIDIVSGNAGAGIKPAGAKTEFLANGSTAWQIFQTIVDNREKAAARVYLGTDAILGSVGGAPGVDISELFKIASTLIQGDLWAIEEALRTGLYEPWCAVNFGDSQYAPHLEYDVPDPDAERKEEERRKNRQDFYAAVEKHKSLGFRLDAEALARIAREHNIDDVPELAPSAAQSVSLPLAPADLAKVVTVNEVRRSLGLQPLAVGGDITLPQLEANATAAATAAAPPKAAP